MNHVPGRTNKGFTLLEMLLVIAIIAILASIVIVAINPAKQLADANNAQRYSDLRAIHQALEQYFLDNGAYPLGDDFPESLTEVCDTGSIAGDGDDDPSDLGCDSELVDLSDLVPTYLSAIPVDPSATGDGVGYMVGKRADTKLAAVAPDTQNLDSNDDLIIQIGTTTATVGDFGDLEG